MKFIVGLPPVTAAHFPICARLTLWPNKTPSHVSLMVLHNLWKIIAEAPRVQKMPTNVIVSASREMLIKSDIMMTLVTGTSIGINSFSKPSIPILS